MIFSINFLDHICPQNFFKLIFARKYEYGSHQSIYLLKTHPNLFYLSHYEPVLCAVCIKLFELEHREHFFRLTLGTLWGAGGLNRGGWA